MNDATNPYASPQDVESPLVPRSPIAWARPFESGRTRVIWAVASIALGILLDFVGIYSGFLHRDALMHARQGHALEVGEIMRHSLVNSALWLTNIGALIPCMMWTHRVYRNLPALGAQRLKFTPAWAVGWYFVPLANWVMPYLVFSEIWRNSDPDRAETPRGEPPLVVNWWGGHVFVSLIVVWYYILYLPPVLHLSAQTFDGLIEMTQLSIAARFIAAATHLLAIVMFLRVDAMQQARYNSLHGEWSDNDIRVIAARTIEDADSSGPIT